MTVCIAAICQEDGESRILHCVDTRLSDSWSGSVDRAKKIRPIGHGWVALLAGDWLNCVNLSDAFAESWQKADAPTRKDEALALADSIVSRFPASGLYRKSYQVQLLLSGFVNLQAMIIEVSTDAKNKGSAIEHSEFAVIGEGATIATVFLRERQCYSRQSPERAAYIAYEAKRYSERMGGISRETLIGFTAPPAPLSKSSAADTPGVVLKQEAIDYLEELFQKSGLQPVPVVAFPPDSLI